MTLKRFRHFVNSEETDRNVLFVEERGQIRPATAEERATVAAGQQGRGGGVTGERWHDVCALEDLVEGTGVAALVGGRQIAIFQVHGRVYALDNFDPASRANVLSRGLTGNLQGERVVASPIYKHHYALTSGRCIEDPTFNVTAYPARVVDGRVQLEVPRTLRTHAPGGGRQRHGRHARGRGAAEARRRRPLQHHRVRRRAARQLQPHPAVAGAVGRGAGRRHHAAPAGLVHAARHHAACRRSHRRDRPQASAWFDRATAWSRRTTGC